MPVSIAYVTTDAAPRYAKQLASHLGRKAEVEDLPGGGYRLALQAGEGVLSPEADRLIMRAAAADAESLDTVKDVLGRHLEHFGRRNDVTVTWEDEDR
ncbi:DUF2218 domain-containing protein [Microtetraspora sp. NBRC 16547]|uniref:DUF2218 domain-containing protein n=1 Tax=Microtetraspora sp. NBRC 16547 TaxID=3030993 RepID=UPI0024A29E1B|nr:DUF2218 domain-containing protein [Microtetraspora sp. NBRC 16547]GLW99420.1 hypothetical protein Misp02_35070 [Microtetraspora sp. NBRC 16547]